MTHSRIRPFGLILLAVLGLLALGASGAQAANEFLLLHPGKTFAEEEIESETLTGELEGKEFHILVPEKLFEITCELGQINAATVYATLLHVKILLEDCALYEIFEDSPDDYYGLPKLDKLPCKVLEQPLEIIAKAAPILHENTFTHKKETFLLFEALEEGKPLIEKIKFQGLICPPESSLTGSVVSTINQLNVVAQLFGFRPLTTLLFQLAELPGDELVYAGTEAYFEGAFDEVKLTGPNMGEAWGAH